MDNGEVYFTLGRLTICIVKEYEQALKYYKLLLDYKGGFLVIKDSCWKKRQSFMIV